MSCREVRHGPLDGDAGYGHLDVDSHQSGGGDELIGGLGHQIGHLGPDVGAAHPEVDHRASSREVVGPEVGLPPLDAGQRVRIT
ncbi:MAG: hypothetical protein U5R31_08115 [Acidimicrobiia bacterium]|nr:hypothetical protein [Acidimicrobiia bacterium]